jgi:nanoRNase/pAp phosphatase (c-di-AMP/oligoRNAs hydrolase)
VIDFELNSKKIPAEKIEDYKYVHSLTQIDSNRVAFHRADADGVVSAVIVKKIFHNKNLVFIPIGYEALNMDDFSWYLSNLQWFAIVDLPPFSAANLELYCDHHVSNVGLKIRANLTLFDSAAPSAAYILAHHFPNINEKSKELAKLTEITDTADFTISPPLDTKKNYSTEQERAWALNDTCKAVDSSRKIIELVEKFSLEGFEAIPRHFNVILSRYRQKRRESIDYVKNFEISDLVILNFLDDSFNRFDILHELLCKGAKIVISFLNLKSYYVLNFRQSKELTAEEKLIFRLDKLAEEFGGGGHISASGARVKNYQRALGKILVWSKKQKLSNTIYDIPLGV